MFLTISTQKENKRFFKRASKSNMSVEKIMNILFKLRFVEVKFIKLGDQLKLTVLYV